MNIAYFIKTEAIAAENQVGRFLDLLRAGGAAVYPVSCPGDIHEDTDVLVSIGGDGTLLSAARIAVPADLPVACVNLGRLGFLSQGEPEEVAAALLSGSCHRETRTILKASVAPGIDESWPCALNEVSISRIGAAMLGIDVMIDGEKLPTYWADGLLVATSSGSTAYSLSVGGPICMPESKVLIVAPISPHNLNVRPLVIPESSKVRLTLRSREPQVVFSMDNRNFTISSDSVISIETASERLTRLRPGDSNFINALRSRLHWGEDARNNVEQS